MGRGPHKKVSGDVRARIAESYTQMCIDVIEIREMTAGEIAEIDAEALPLGKRAILKAYAKGDFRTIKDYEDRLWGRPRETVDLKSGDDNKFSIIFKNATKTPEK